ncbi:formin-binding protein 1a [Aulostomus maculatus]
MSCNWGTELWDQFDNLEKHTSWGIDFLERYTKFVKERADIEQNYAKQIRSLSKKYHPKRSREDDSRYTWYLAFAATLRQLNELAVQREELAENLNTQIVSELSRYTQELKTERKTHFQDGRRAQQHIENSWKQLESSKRHFERDCKEAERAQHISDRTDLDNKADGEKRCSLKARQVAQQKQQAADESKKEYVTSLNQFNQDQHQHYHTMVPVIYQRIQDMEERRIERVGEAMRLSAEAERKTLPLASACLDVMMEAAESIQPRMDARRVVEVYKSGFDPPGDVEFEDYSATMRRSISESSYLDNRTEGRRHRKLWPFIRKNKLLTLLSSPRQPPPPPPTSPSPRGVANSPQSPPPASREPISQRLNDLMTSGSRTRKQCLRSLKRGNLMFQGAGPADGSHLSPEQRQKKLQSRITQISQEIQREREQRDALLKMREVYERSPQMGDAGTLEPQLEELKQSLHRLEAELRRNQVWLAEVDTRLSEHGGRRQSGGLGLNSQVTTPSSSSLKQLDSRSPASRESPDGSYTEDQSAELHFKSRSSEFDDDFDDDEPLPSIGTCKSLYPFQGQNEGTLSIVEGELLSVVEEDKGDGWTRVRRNMDEEGYVPTSYIKVFLDSSAKGFVQSSRLV